MSCLFNSIGKHVKETPQNVRILICNYIENSKTLAGLPIEAILCKPKNEYITRMRLPNSWGGGPEIAAACDIWNLNINVYKVDRVSKKNSKKQIKNKLNTAFMYDKPIIFKSSVPTNNQINLYWNGVHYEPGPF